MVDLRPDSPAWAGPFNFWDQAVVYTGTPLVDGAVVGTIATLSEDGLTLELRDGRQVWFPRHAVSALMKPDDLGRP